MLSTRPRFRWVCALPDSRVYKRFVLTADALASATLVKVRRFLVITKRLEIKGLHSPNVAAHPQLELLARLQGSQGANLWESVSG